MCAGRWRSTIVLSNYPTPTIPNSSYVDVPSAGTHPHVIVMMMVVMMVSIIFVEKKFQLSMYDNCGEIPHVEKFQMSFIAIYAVLLLNLLFATIYAVWCGEKLSPKVHLWRKMTNIWSDNIPQHDDHHIISAHCSWVKVRVDSLPESILLPY